MTQPQYIVSSNPISDSASYIINALKDHLAKNEKVFLLIPGGSAIAVSLEVAEGLKGTDCTNLTISLTDERYGDVGHSDSSFAQTMAKGFNIEGATLIPVLSGKDAESTISDYNDLLMEEADEADFIIGLFGIGADGHTAGILPGSPAVTNTDYACGYEGGKYYRITVTPKFIEHIDEVVVYAVGEEKKESLEKLKSEQPLTDQPAQALKKAGKFIIYNN